jgi:hypothetical protein
MSFAISAAGDTSHARRQVRAVRAYGTDQSQYDRVRALLLDELADLPAGQHVIIEASGHHDQYGRTLQLSLRTVHLAELSAEIPGEAA